VSDYTVCRIEDVPDIFGGQYPGKMRSFTGALGAEQVAFTHRTMPQGSGGKGSYGHRHKTQEEIYFLISGRLEMKLGDDVIALEPGAVVRVAPGVYRSIHNSEPEEAVVVIVSKKVDDPVADGEYVEGFWPVEESPA
jgi:mannose-6-phosphate isomerase-like protein (cupin superfamily)